MEVIEIPGKNIGAPLPRDNCPVPVVGPALRPLLIGVGVFFVVLGAVGTFIPGLPTTIFLIVAAWCFARSSTRFYGWLYSRPRFGPLLINWERHRVIPAYAKALAIGSMTASLVYVSLFVAQDWVAPALMFLVMAPVSVYILTRASRVPASEPAQPQAGFKGPFVEG